MRLQNRLLLLVFAAALPAWLVAAALLFIWNADPALKWALLVLISAFATGCAFTVRERTVHPLHSLANLLEALREGDYSLRARNANSYDALGEVMIEVNALSRALHEQRLEAIEASVLLEKVSDEIDIAVFAFDAAERLRLVNRAGAALLGADNTALRGRTAYDLGLSAMLRVPSGSIISHAFQGDARRWEIRRRAFRESGRPHELLVISDLSRALREEERQAWRRLVRVIGHELNGSLAPIRSMASTLRRLTGREPLPADWRTDVHAGLGIIHDRAESLTRFMGAYARLARLPPPMRRRVEFGDLVRRAASLHGERVTIESSPEVVLEVDGDQIEQVLINLIQNGVEAAGGPGGTRVRWSSAHGRLHAEVEDDGPGISRTDNLWVPFFTTKPGGTGIGLVLSREIVENHGSLLSLENRRDARGGLACISLPLGATARPIAAKA